MLPARITEDIVLRRYGYRILSRPAHGEAVWVLVYGVIHTHSQALECVRKRQELRRKKTSVTFT